jgi:diketogulonate reductase-like aldo/keto reductase
MIDRSQVVDGIRIPRFAYGTAWKESETERLTRLAIDNGFRGIDTANQRKHYFEAAVGRGIQSAMEAGIVQRHELFIQTKFTFRDGQDHRLPYDPAAAIPIQVEQSFASSLEHLGVETIDSYVLHGPTQRVGLSADDLSAWRAMEAIHERGKAKWLGISNVSLEQLRAFCQHAQVKPRFVQNRCYAVRGWDREVRRFCVSNGIIYQGFSLLTANRDVLKHPDVRRLAKQLNRTESQIVFRIAMAIGILPLTGTTNAEHMRQDLEAFDFDLLPEDVNRIENLAG